MVVRASVTNTVTLTIAATTPNNAIGRSRLCFISPSPDLAFQQLGFSTTQLFKNLACYESEIYHINQGLRAKAAISGGTQQLVSGSKQTAQ
jgi:hypothetical protein